MEASERSRELAEFDEDDECRFVVASVGEIYDVQILSTPFEVPLVRG